MSRIKKTHPRPSWAWSGVVLLSTLLLSPVASANLLSALGRVLPFASASHLPAQMPQTAPRRTPDEEEAARVLLHSVLGERDAETEAEVLRGGTVSPSEPHEAIAPEASRPVLSSFFLAAFAARPSFSARVFCPSLSVFVGLRASRAPPLV